MSDLYNENGGSFTFTPQDCATVALRSITDNTELNELQAWLAESTFLMYALTVSNICSITITLLRFSEEDFVNVQGIH
jgi:hypothetical protein